MPEISRKRYCVSLNDFAGVVDFLRRPEDAPGVNYTHKDGISAFGTLAYTRTNEAWEQKPCNSPLNLKSWQFEEYRCGAVLEQQEGDTFRFRNICTGHTLVYTFGEEEFTMEFSGVLPDGDQIAADLNLAFLDTRQNDPQENQFTLSSFYTSWDRKVVYLVLKRFDVEEYILLRSLKNCAGWRLRYNDSPAIDGIQFIHRFSREVDPGATPGAPFDFGIGVSFHDSFDSVRKTLEEKSGLPLIDLPVQAVRCGGTLSFLAHHAVSARLIAPDGNAVEIPLTDGVGTVTLEQEGFYRIRSFGADGTSYEAVARAFPGYMEMLQRERLAIQPYFRSFNIEVSSWVRAMCIARKLAGPEERMEGYLHDFLINIGMQGIPGDCFPGKIPPEEESAKRIHTPSPRHSCHWKIVDGLFTGAPAPRDFVCDGFSFKAGHLLNSHRIQDGFGFIMTFLYAAEAFHCREFYEQAVKIAFAYLDSHLAPNGALMRYSPPERTMIDYTTVVSPLESLTELYREMKHRNDPRAEKIRQAGIRIADYLVARKLKRMPTEGTQVFLRWSSDGTVASSAWSLLAAYTALEPKKEYWENAAAALRRHESWHVHTDDVRSGETAWRYWETQWENDGEGHSINCGHAWSLERAEALFLYGKIAGDPEALRQSYGTFMTNLCNHHADGKNSSCFTPDAMPRKLLKKKLYCCYPEFPDHAMSYYVWERLQDSWFKTAVIFWEPRTGKFTALNGDLAVEKDQMRLEPYAPLLEEVLCFGLPEKCSVLLPEKFNSCRFLFIPEQPQQLQPHLFQSDPEFFPVCKAHFRFRPRHKLS